MLEVNQMFEGNLVSFVSQKQVNTVLHGVQLVLMWTRLLGVLITTKAYGPLLRMIHIVVKDLDAFLLLYFTVIFAAAGGITLIFSDLGTDGHYESFFTSIRTLYGSSLGIFDIEVFETYKILGGVIFGVFMLMSFVLLLHLLIAMLVHVYNNQVARMDGEYRSILISYYDKYCWDNQFGILIFMPSPFTLVTMLIAVIYLVKPQSTQYNLTIAKCFYWLYALFQFAIFTILTAFYMPLVYVKSSVAISKRVKLKRRLYVGNKYEEANFKQQPKYRGVRKSWIAKID